MLTHELADWHKQPLYLTISEIENPLSVLEAFFDCYHLPQARTCLKQWLDQSLRADDADGASLISVYDAMNRLVEASWLIFQQKLTLGLTIDVLDETNLRAIISLLVAVMAPERIYLISIQPRDLLIVISDTVQRPFKEYERILEMVGLGSDPIYFSLHKSCDLRRQVTEGHIYYSSICIPENVVYDNGRSSEFVANVSDIELMKSKAIKQFDFGIKRGLSFLHCAQYHQLKHENEMCAFMLHQAAELSLRAFIRAMSGQDIRTHEITTLLKYASRFARNFTHTLRKNPDQEEKTPNLLEQAYMNARYTDNFEISDKDIHEPFVRITDLLAEIQSTFTQKMGTLPGVYENHSS